MLTIEYIVHIKKKSFKMKGPAFLTKCPGKLGGLSCYSVLTPGNPIYANDILMNKYSSNSAGYMDGSDHLPSDNASARLLSCSIVYSSLSLAFF